MIVSNGFLWRIIFVTKATAEILKNEQRTDKSLAQCWTLAERDKAGYFVKDGILYRHQKLYGFDYEQLMLPFTVELRS